MVIEDINELYQALDRVRVENILINEFGITINEIIKHDWKLLDDLDKVEFIMNIEKDFDIMVDDVLAEFIISNIKLNDFLSNITSVRRNIKLKDLGI